MTYTADSRNATFAVCPQLFVHQSESICIYGEQQETQILGVILAILTQAYAYPLYGSVLFSQAMQEAMTESKAKKFYLYSGHDNTGSFASNLV